MAAFFLKSNGRTEVCCGGVWVKPAVKGYDIRLSLLGSCSGYTAPRSRNGNRRLTKV